MEKIEIIALEIDELDPKVRKVVCEKNRDYNVGDGDQFEAVRLTFIEDMRQLGIHASVEMRSGNLIYTDLEVVDPLTLVSKGCPDALRNTDVSNMLDGFPIAILREQHHNLVGQSGMAMMADMHKVQVAILLKAAYPEIRATLQVAVDDTIAKFRAMTAHLFTDAALCNTFRQEGWRFTEYGEMIDPRLLS